MGCDVSQLSRLARQELLSSLRKGCLGIWGFISCLLFNSSSVFCCSQQVALYCDVCNLPGPEEKPFFFFVESLLNRFPEKYEELVTAHALQEKIMIDALTEQK